MANGLLSMSPGIEAYQQDYAGWQPGTPKDAQAYYKIINMMRSLPPEQRPTTDMEIMNFMRAYSGAMGDYSGYIPMPQNVDKYLNVNVVPGTDEEIYRQLIQKVGPSMRGLLGE
jgi:hypothetical protein